MGLEQDDRPAAFLCLKNVHGVGVRVGYAGTRSGRVVGLFLLSKVVHLLTINSFC